MRKLVLILIGFTAVITFIRAYDNNVEIPSDIIPSVSAPVDVNSYKE